MSNISKTITIDISVKPGVMETIKIGAQCSLEEIALYKTLFQDSMTFLLGHMKRWLASIHELLYMKSIHMMHLGPFGRDSSQFIPKRKQLLKKK